MKGLALTEGSRPSVGHLLPGADMLIRPARTGDLYADGTMMAFLHSRGIRARPPRPAPEPSWQHASKPDPEWSCIPLYDVPQMSDERWDALASSQARAIELIEAGQLEEALAALRTGTWRDPEGELRELVVYVHGERTLPDANRPSPIPNVWKKEAA